MSTLDSGNKLEPKITGINMEYKDKGQILFNPGCGILYLQRGRNKLRYEDVAQDNWFIRERLTDKIAFSLTWSVLEPEEGKYCWNHPDWEGAINSWIENGYKVALQVRGMGTLGTCYNDGVPQWVFDAGAKFIDEPIEKYRKTFLLNNIPSDCEDPIRYPVYWDPIYLAKVEQLVKAMGERYNGRPEIEFIGIGHMGRWGEMHIAEHNPLKPWLDAGLSIENYISGHKKIIDIYREAFPDTELSQEIGSPAFGEEGAPNDYLTLDDAGEILEYLAENRIHIKFNGLGKSWHGGSPYLEGKVKEIMQRYRHRTKICFENLVLPEALEEGLECGMTYWHRGGESQGLGVMKIDNDIPIQDKKIFSFYPFFTEQYDALTLEDQKNVWRNMALKCGYRLLIEDISLSEDFSGARLRLRNIGAAPCYERMKLSVSLVDSETEETVAVKESELNSDGFWDRNEVIEIEHSLSMKEISASCFELKVQIVSASKHNKPIQLANSGCNGDGAFSCTYKGNKEELLEV